jgi:hypothetical protein
MWISRFGEVLEGCFWCRDGQGREQPRLTVADRMGVGEVLRWLDM